MRKRSNRRPRQVLANPLGYVLESSRMLVDHETYVVDWQLKNNVAFGALLRGEAKKADLDTLVAARNISEALVHVLGGHDVDGTLERSACALIEICARANAGKGTAMKAAEIQAMRDMLAFHDELLEVVTVGQFEQALTYARREIQAGRTQHLKEVKP